MNEDKPKARRKSGSLPEQAPVNDRFQAKLRDDSAPSSRHPELAGVPYEVAISAGADAASAYVGPTAIPESAHPKQDTQKVRLNTPEKAAQVAVTVKITRPQANQAKPAGAIEAPLDRPAGAFQPVAVDPELMKEWAARNEKGKGASAAGGAGGADGGVGSSPWAVTEKIDRSALPSSLAPGQRAALASDSGVSKAPVVDAPSGPRRGWGLLALMAVVGIGGGVLVLKLMTDPPSAPTDKGTPAAGTGAPVAVPAPSGAGSASPQKQLGAAPPSEWEAPAPTPIDATGNPTVADTAAPPSTGATPPAGQTKVFPSVPPVRQPPTGSTAPPIRTGGTKPPPPKSDPSSPVIF